MLYRFEKDGVTHYTEANNSWEACLQVELSTGEKMTGAKLYAIPTAKHERFLGTVKC